MSIGLGKHRVQRYGPAASPRPLFTLLLSLLLLIQAVAASAASVAQHSGEPAVGIAVQGVSCVVNAHGDAPPAHEAGHCDCCIFCGARDVLGGALADPIPVNATLQSPSAFHSAAGWRQEALSRPPTGWASSWSSQAPPSFS